VTSVVDLVQALQANAAEPAFAWASWRGTLAREAWSRGDLHYAAMCAAGAIAAASDPGDRVVIALPPGLPFVATMLGCLGAGRIAVPAQTPATARARAALDGVARTAGARLVLTTPVCGPPRKLAAPAPGDIAYLQFTSGSTRAPRGAAISWGALHTNISAIASAWQLTAADRGVFWLPPHHDMGLVGALLTPLAVGFPATLMHPAAFLQRPLRWLELIAAERATFSGAPNFAYDLCVERTTPQERARLDLSSWRTAVNGAEPVSEKTLSRFADAFATAGFDPRALAPGYGLAESVLFVTACGADAPVRVSRNVVSCGRPARGVTVRIVDEGHGCVVGDGATGAIWVAGPSLASGYWQDAAESAAAFGAHLPDDSRGYLRTGDLGWMEGGHLFVRGRAKDVIVVAGRKVHAVDLEHAIREELRDGRRSAAFAAMGEDGGRERLVIVHECAPDTDLAAVRSAIVDALGRAFDLVPDRLVLTTAGAVRVTTSGKTARAATREAWRTGAIKEMTCPRSIAPAPSPAKPNSATSSATRSPAPSGSTPATSTTTASSTPTAFPRWRP
jgi:acyl-CoA synthetase (AMP-forming)/AMP-acid ligase II